MHIGHTVIKSPELSDVVDFASEDMTLDGLETGHRPANVSNQVALLERFFGGQVELDSSKTPSVRDGVKFSIANGTSVS